MVEIDLSIKWIKVNTETISTKKYIYIFITFRYFIISRIFYLLKKQHVVKIYFYLNFKKNLIKF